MLTVKGRIPGGPFTEVQFAGKKIGVVLTPAKSQRLTSSENKDLFIAPGFIDIQVNGFAGIDFNHPNFCGENLVTVCKRILRTGITRFCPTLVTGSSGRLSRSIQETLKAYKKHSLVRSMVLGIHLEGPYINSDDGPRGAHPKAHISDPDWEEFYRLYKLSNGLLRLVTVAPELTGGLEFIKKASQTGLIVGLGHCAPDPEIIDAAADAGAILSIHLGNGAHHMLPRHTNYIQKQIAHNGLMASIICDGNHLPDYFVKNLVRAKGKSKIILITDATAATEAPPGRYTLGELVIEASEDGILRLPGTPYLAGSTLTMDKAVINCARFARVTLGSAINMATMNPAKLFDGISGRLEAGQRADLVLFRVKRDGIHIVQVYLAGRLLYSA